MNFRTIKEVFVNYIESVIRCMYDLYFNVFLNRQDKTNYHHVIDPMTFVMQSRSGSLSFSGDDLGFLHDWYNA